MSAEDPPVTQDGAPPGAAPSDTTAPTDASVPADTAPPSAAPQVVAQPEPAAPYKPLLSQPSPARRKDKVSGMLIVFVTFLATLSLAWWAKWKNTPVPPEPPAAPSSSAVVGFPGAVDAIATLPAARERTPRDVLRGILLRGVNSEGLVDSSAEGTEVRYVFQSRPGEGPQPPRDPEGRPSRPYCGKQVVRVKPEGLQEDEDETKYMCASKGFEPLPDPRCGPKEVWAHAIAKEIPTDKLAQIEYYRAQAGPAWRFRIPGTRHRFSLYGDCERELKGTEEVGSVP